MRDYNKIIKKYFVSKSFIHYQFDLNLFLYGRSIVVFKVVSKGEFTDGRNNNFRQREN